MGDSRVNINIGLAEGFILGAKDDGDVNHRCQNLDAAIRCLELAKRQIKGEV